MTLRKLLPIPAFLVVTAFALTTAIDLALAGSLALVIEVWTYGLVYLSG